MNCELTGNSVHRCGCVACIIARKAAKSIENDLAGNVDSIKKLCRCDTCKAKRGTHMTTNERYNDILPDPAPLVNAGENIHSFDDGPMTTRTMDAGGSRFADERYGISGRDMTPQEMLEEIGISGFEPEERKIDQGDEPDARAGAKLRGRQVTPDGRHLGAPKRKKKGAASEDIEGHPESDEDLGGPAGFMGRDAESESLERDRTNRKRLSTNQGIVMRTDGTAERYSGFYRPVSKRQLIATNVGQGPQQARPDLEMI